MEGFAILTHDDRTELPLKTDYEEGGCWVRIGKWKIYVSNEYIEGNDIEFVRLANYIESTLFNRDVREGDFVDLEIERRKLKEADNERDTDGDTGDMPDVDD